MMDGLLEISSEGCSPFIKRVKPFRETLGATKRYTHLSIYRGRIP